jgi:hypothetical protein
MMQKYEMSMIGKMSCFLGVQVKQSSDGIFINQAKYTREMIARFGVEKERTVSVPMSPGWKIHSDPEGKPVNPTEYRALIGSLLYLTASRPDISYAVGVCARFQSDPRQYHLDAARNILKYLKGTINLGLWYPRDDGMELSGYSDADFGTCKINRKSTTGTCQFLGSKLVSWFSKKQTSVATSTTEAEYMAAGSCCSQLLWLKHQLGDYNIEAKETPIYCDSTSAISMTSNPILHSRCKHIEIRHHFIRDHVEKKDVVLVKINTDIQRADILTKPLAQERFNMLCVELGLLDPEEDKVELIDKAE